MFMQALTNHGINVELSPHKKNVGVYSVNGTEYHSKIHP